jgi:alpha-L-fucosidase
MCTSMDRASWGYRKDMTMSTIAKENEIIEVRALP